MKSLSLIDQNKNNGTTIILTVHNKADLLKRVLDGIYNHVSINSNQIIINIDGCTDESANIALDYINADNDEESGWHVIPFFKKDSEVIINYLPNVFELKANNYALRQVRPENTFCIIIQDDQVVTEDGFDTRLIYPMLKWNDVWAVSAKNAHNIHFTGDTLECLGYDDITGDGTDKNDPNVLYIRQTINRGPLAVRMNTIRELGYFDEIFCPQGQDDQDLSIRAYKELNMVCGSLKVGFESRAEWGSTRKPEASSWIYPTIYKNQKTILRRYPEYVGYYLTGRRIEWNEERNLE